MNIVRCVFGIADWRHFYEPVLAARGSFSTGSSGNFSVRGSGAALVYARVINDRVWINRDLGVGFPGRSSQQSGLGGKQARVRVCVCVRASGMVTCAEKHVLCATVGPHV